MSLRELWYPGEEASAQSILVSTISEFIEKNSTHEESFIIRIERNYLDIYVLNHVALQLSGYSSQRQIFYFEVTLKDMAVSGSYNSLNYI